VAASVVFIPCGPVRWARQGTEQSPSDCLGARDPGREVAQRRMRAISSTSAGRQTWTSAAGIARKASSQSLANLLDEGEAPLA
jgi:hypothetical protein